MTSTSAAVVEPSRSAAIASRAGASPRKASKIKTLNRNTSHRLTFAQRYGALTDLSGDAIKTLGELVGPDHAPAIRLAAAKEILDRVDGKPRQAATLEVKTDMTTLHLDALRALAAQAPALIDVSPLDSAQTDGD